MLVSPRIHHPWLRRFPQSHSRIPLRIPETPRRGLIPSRPPAVLPLAARTVLTWAAVPVPVPVPGEGEPA